MSAFNALRERASKNFAAVETAFGTLRKRGVIETVLDSNNAKYQMIATPEPESPAPEVVPETSPEAATPETAPEAAPEAG